ncbi:hypothetical protein [Microbacterium sp. NPDC056234]|uniref:hypothetical protein n=1 Tax=Microbacterium sp. NPDC056234 TaxID=3345757 RepID=UPI0035DACBBD
MEWLATLGAAGITGSFALAGTVLQRTAPRELRRARQLSAELETMEAGSPSARLVAAARDDLVAAAVIRTIVTPWSITRGITFALIGAALTLAVVAFVPMVHGILATVSGAPDDTATLMTLMLAGSSIMLLLLALIPAVYSDKQLKEFRTRFRADWGLPDELQLRRFSDEVPAPRE